MLGEEDLANRFLDDYYLNGRIRIADLGGEGVNAETGPEGLSGWVWGSGENAMTLDDGILTLADTERIWEKRHFSPALPVVSWAVTVYHEYIHMDQKNPKNEPYYEDPAWQATDRALARWCERLRKQFDDLQNKPASETKVDKLEQLEEILRQLQGEVTAFQEGVTANIAEGKLSRGLSWEYPRLWGKIDGLIQDVRAEIKNNKAALQTPAGGSVPSGTGTSGGTGSVPGPSSSSYDSPVTVTHEVDTLDWSEPPPPPPDNPVAVPRRDSPRDKTQENKVKVFVNGQKLQFDVPPLLEKGRVLVPIRKITEALGAQVDWDPRGYVRIRKGDQDVLLQIDQNVALVDYEHKYLDVPPKVVNGRTLVPLRFVAEAFGLNVGWDDSTQTVTISGN
jgi:hypothetical protein